MLFDLRGRHRRRAVRVIYMSLALLMGAGLVLFGVGSFGGTGVLSNVANNEGKNAATFAGEVARYRKLSAAQPSNQAAWLGLTKALLHESSLYTQNGVSAKGKELFADAAQSWGTYLALNPSTPDPSIAQQMFTVYSEEGLNQPNQAVQVLQILVAAKPTSASLWGQLAIYAYKAHNPRVGDLAAKKAVALAPAVERKRVAAELAEVRRNPSSEKTYTTVTNGKTYAVKKAPNGSFTGTQVTTPPPAAATTGSTTKK
jgi:hypothetical protein